ncbi:MAG: hypothetical protein Q7R55_01520 [Candidatus Wildermuthbacteria bacterium]|nr:hypothetical protein [Candidatus Wildermuthbacteria bacterium]
MRKILGLTLLLALASVFVWSSVSAETIEIKNPLNAKNLFELIDNIIRFIFNIAFVLLPLMVVIGAFMFLTAGGKPEQITKARALLLWTAVGFGVILVARGLPAVLRQILG